MIGSFAGGLRNQLEDERDRDEFNPFVPLAVVLILFIISGILSYNEFKYAVWGRTADAEIFRMKETAFSAGERKGPMVEVRYRWTDKDDGDREDSMLRDPAEWPYQVGDRFKIDYMPGVMKSRVAGTPMYATIAIGFFVVLGGAALVLFALLWRQGARTARSR